VRPQLGEGLRGAFFDPLPGRSYNGRSGGVTLPLYEYLCPTDGRFEIIQKFSDEALKVCPTCGRPVQKLLSAPAIRFKGTGWYVTDYAKKGSSGESGHKEDKGKKDAAAEAAPATSDRSSSGSSKN